MCKLQQNIFWGGQNILAISWEKHLASDALTKGRQFPTLSLLEGNVLLQIQTPAAEKQFHPIFKLYGVPAVISLSILSFPKAR